MSNNLPNTITVTETHERKLDLSRLRYAVVSPCKNTVYALFGWRDRAETYVMASASDLPIIDLKPQLPIVSK